MLEKLILKQAIPVFESKIKKIISDDVKKLGIDSAFTSILKFNMLNGEIKLQLCNEGEVIKDYSKDEIKANINELVASKIKKVFINYAELNDVDEDNIFFYIDVYEGEITVAVSIHEDGMMASWIRNLTLDQLLLEEPKKI